MAMTAVVNSADVRLRVRNIREILANRVTVNDGALRYLVGMYRSVPEIDRDLAYRIASRAAYREAARRGI